MSKNGYLELVIILSVLIIGLFTGYQEGYKQASHDWAYGVFEGFIRSDLGINLRLL
jgi:hypothetical protein